MSRFSYHCVWRSLDDDSRAEIIGFWSDHRAITDERVARERVDQVVCTARDASGTLAGVCTVVPRRAGDLGHELYYYRTFVAPPFRSGLVVKRLLVKAVAVLEAYSREHPESTPAGVYIELENPLFAKHLRQPVWPWPEIPFVYIGRTPRGLERRLYWFRHTRI